MSDDTDRPAPAFYAARKNSIRPALFDWWVLLHPPYTMWHLSYVVIGASIAPRFDGGRLAATLVAFLLAVGIGAHALDELKGRPLRTAISRSTLIAVAIAGIGTATAIGIVGIAEIGPGLAVFVIAGVLLNVGYNLELFGGRLHNGVIFAAAWGAFPVLTGYYAQAETLRLPALLAGAAAYWLSAAQRSLSTPARTLRRQVSAVDGTVAYADGREARLSRSALLAPLETALKHLSYGMLALAVALVLYRTGRF